MLRIMFWNLNRQPLKDEVASLAMNHRIDLLVLAEDVVVPTARLRSLNKNDCAYFMTTTNCDRINIYTTFNDRFIKLRRESKYFTFREIYLPARSSFLLFAIHWKSNLWRSKESQSSSLIEIAHLIREEEEKCGHQRTIVTGDFNVDPFAQGMMSASGLHGVMSRRVAARNQREVSPFGSFPFFYNPMWSIYGDESDGPPGTYFRSNSEDICQYWHIFDQFLIRPDLLPFLPEKSVRVLTEAGEKTLVNNSGHPSASDHLPLLFQFDLPISAGDL